MQVRTRAQLNDRRHATDRRTNSTSTSFWSICRLRGRRRSFRRHDDARCGTIDCPAPWVIVLVLWVTVCSALDALFTLIYISNGGGEANPVMSLALTYGTSTFVNLKMGITCFGVWTLSVFQYVPLAGLVLLCLTLIYLGIMGLHAILLLS